MRVARDEVSLLEVLREDLGIVSVKDGCSPQGQCGCCTVLVDGTPRVSCVTPVRRVAGRAITTVDGLEAGRKDRLVEAFLSHGASQCGFCTPGILCRLASLADDPPVEQVESALLAHLCRCTGWRTIVDAARTGRPPATATRAPASPATEAARRAAIEGGVAQAVGPSIVLGGGGFADDTAPPGCLVAVPDGKGGWAVGETLHEARRSAGKVQGRRSGHGLRYPVELPPGSWDLVLQTTWVEPGYLEPDASWCRPGDEPASSLANGGAFGAKLASVAPAAARELADRYRRPVRVVFSREDVVRLGPKRPPMAAGFRSDGTGVVRVAATPGVAAAIAGGALSLEVEVQEVDIEYGPPVSAALRGAGWAEAAVLSAAVQGLGDLVPGRGEATVAGPPGGGWARAEVAVGPDGWPAEVGVRVGCGDPLSETVLRSYVVGAAHMALGWICSEGIAVDEEGEPVDLTIRSFGILRAKDTPPIEVSIDPAGPPVNGSDAAFAAVAAATWLAQGLPPRWPTRR